MSTTLMSMQSKTASPYLLSLKNRVNSPHSFNKSTPLDSHFAERTLSIPLVNQLQSLFLSLPSLSLTLFFIIVIIITILTSLSHIHIKISLQNLFYSIYPRTFQVFSFEYSSNYQTPRQTCFR